MALVMSFAEVLHTTLPTGLYCWYIGDTASYVVGYYIAVLHLFSCTVHIAYPLRYDKNISSHVFCRTVMSNEQSAWTDFTRVRHL